MENNAVENTKNLMWKIQKICSGKYKIIAEDAKN